jgi:hypothetical protein
LFSELTAVCGVSCTLCPAYQATRGVNRAELERIAEEWSAGLKKKFSAEDILCDGCRIHGRKSAYCKTCEILSCAQGRGHLTCAHCPESPCEKLKAPQAREALAVLKKELGL